MNNNTIIVNNIDGDTMEIQYPRIAFAFNPITISLTNRFPSPYPSIRIKIKDRSNEYVEILKEPANDGNYRVDYNIEGVVKKMFNTKLFSQVKEVDDNLVKDVEFSLWDGDINIYDGVITVIWGGLQIGQKYTQKKEYTYFKGFPFTVPFFTEIETQLYCRVDSLTGREFVKLDKGKYNIDVSKLNADRFITIGTGSSGSVFDYTFDHTFGGVVHSVSDALININIKKCPNNGIYLRWINKLGEYNYYLFSEGVKTVEIKNSSVKYDNIYYTTDFTNNYHIGTGNSIGKEISDTVKIYASLVDDSTYNHLLDLVESPIVDLFVGYSDTSNPIWVSTSIDDVTFERSSANLQDFECVLIANKRQVQTL